MSVFVEIPSDEDLEHYGVLGMKWGIRKDPQAAYKKSYNKLSKLDAKAKKAERKAGRKETRSMRRQQRADTAWLFGKTKSRLASWAIGRSEKARLKYVKRLSKAMTWYKRMENEFGKTKIKDLDPKRSELGKRYTNMSVENMMMASAQTGMANKQLRALYRSAYTRK